MYLGYVGVLFFIILVVLEGVVVVVICQIVYFWCICFGLAMLCWGIKCGQIQQMFVFQFFINSYEVSIGIVKIIWFIFFLCLVVRFGEGKSLVIVYYFGRVCEYGMLVVVLVGCGYCYVGLFVL